MLENLGEDAVGGCDCERAKEREDDEDGVAQPPTAAAAAELATTDAVATEVGDAAPGPAMRKSVRGCSALDRMVVDVQP